MSTYRIRNAGNDDSIDVTDGVIVAATVPDAVIAAADAAVDAELLLRRGPEEPAFRASWDDPWVAAETVAWADGQTYQGPMGSTALHWEAVDENGDLIDQPELGSLVD